MDFQVGDKVCYHQGQQDAAEGIVTALEPFGSTQYRIWFQSEKYGNSWTAEAYHCTVAQLVERSAVNGEVTGSIPVCAAYF
jgi:hypothetical protein